ncbi:neuropeptide Y receptor type 6 [Solenopsis invicta]|uniref:neuropeptide Y receptor type 6 n=1 Tax=Solenopsis invicta TaxID=13686 RepID=UPI00193E56D7|nr:neuropeptide Y receptor type 6 [Solenopsis invicta]XP_039306580.1 neuropeptide Y receptor type 6 [Solenopsis invicta]
MRSAYSNITDIHNMIALCKRTRSSKYSGRYNYGLWTIEPSILSIIGYTVVIPVVSALGIIGNSLILIVHFKAKTYLKASTYTYLAVLATSDLITCILLVFSSLARGIFRCYKGWLEFDAFVYFPLGSITSNITVWAALGVSVDRLIIVCSMPRSKPPGFCSQHIARKLMIFASCFAILINVPYCFMYKYNDRGDLVTTNFFHSRWYYLQNWFQFIIFGLIPAAFLLVANVIMLYFVRKVLKQREILLKRKNIREGNKLQDQARLTIMLIGIVLLFLVGELPTHLASRRSAVSLLYGGDPSRVHEDFMESFRMWATLLNALSSSTNFILYYLLSSCFSMHFKRMLLPKHIMKRKHARRGPIAYFHQQPGGRAQCEIFVL